ncbi:MAG TPA: NAD(P)-binding domain-containing protein [Thermoleophilaceae bacterium]|nr:NAD(P)-binding domain-containing protein [Thermoleophilaceae bacterium]
MKVAVLGTGIMGGAMARRAAAAGIEVTAWSEPLDDARALAADAVRVAETARDAAAGADVAVTMAPDADAVASVARSFPPSGEFVWCQCATVGLDGCERLAGLARDAGITYVDAPVLGTREPAERGELVILASGPDAALDRCAPFFDAIGSRILRLGPAGGGTRLKLVVNNWIVGTVAVLAEAMALAESLGVDGRVFLDAIAGSAVDMGYAQVKGRMMVERRYPVSMPLAHAAKDARLAAKAAGGHGLEHAVTRAAAALLERAAAEGASGEDMAAAFGVAARRTNR